MKPVIKKTCMKVKVMDGFALYDLNALNALYDLYRVADDRKNLNDFYAAGKDKGAIKCHIFSMTCAGFSGFAASNEIALEAVLDALFANRSTKEILLRDVMGPHMEEYVKRNFVDASCVKYDQIKQELTIALKHTFPEQEHVEHLVHAYCREIAACMGRRVYHGALHFSPSADCNVPRMTGDEFNLDFKAPIYMGMPEFNDVGKMEYYSLMSPTASMLPPTLSKVPLEVTGLSKVPLEVTSEFYHASNPPLVSAAPAVHLVPVVTWGPSC